MMNEQAVMTVKDAESVLRREYYDEVRGIVEEIEGEVRDRIKDGEGGELLREWLVERIDEAVDGHSWVIYTWQAQKVVLFSDNDGAYIDNFGTDGLVDQGGINWSRLAYAAMREDVTEHFGIDVNEPDSDESKEHLGIEDEESTDE